MYDALGKRMKENYEYRAQTHLPRRTNTVIRLDGKAFHTYTRGMQKPFDEELMSCMKHTTIRLCEEIQGCKLGYTQSDEISLLLTDYDRPTSEAWFNGNVQKICSVSAAIATAIFNAVCPKVAGPLPVFDSRVFTIADKVEVANYFLWRMNDAVRNSRQALAQSLYSQKELFGKNVNDLLDMCYAKGYNWNDLPASKKQGYTITKFNNEWLPGRIETNFQEWYRLVTDLTTFEE